MAAPRRRPQEVKVQVYKWNPLAAGYAVAALFYIASFFLFGRTEEPWPVVLLSIAVGFITGLAFAGWMRRRLDRRK